MRQQMLGVQARILNPAFFEINGRGLKNVEHGHFVVPREFCASAWRRRKVDEPACDSFILTPRDPSTTLRCGRDDISWSARCLSIARSDPQLAMLKSFPRGHLPKTGPDC